jgi:Lrp/AsnC family leucine-responsive transcriptional regulator
VKLKEKQMDVLAELIKNARRSDREIGRATRLSQPTVTRIRRNLEKMGLVKEYTVIPDFSKMGYELEAFTLMSFAESKPELFDQAREWIRKQPSVIYANNIVGPTMNSIMISLHKDYTSYTNLMTELKRDWQPNLTDVQSYIVVLERKDLAIREFSYKSLLRNK